jgi:hypothetical protein
MSTTGTGAAAITEITLTDGELDPYVTQARMAALVRPLARTAGPGAGLLLELPGRLLDEEFGAGGVMRFEDVDFPAVLTHEPTRRFLRETGLPEDGFVFQLATDVPLPTLAEHYAAERAGEIAELPGRVEGLIRLGCLVEGADLLVDGSTGAIHAWSAVDAVLRPLDADISTLGFTLWLLHRERALMGEVGQGNGFTRSAGSAGFAGEAYARLAATLSEVLAAVAPVACGPRS